MVVLKKIKASTLMETMIATVLIVIIFMVASLTLNNLFKNSLKFNTSEAQFRLDKLEYQFQHNVLELPYYEDYNGWEFNAFVEIQNELPLIILKAEQKETKRTLKRQIPF